MGIWCPTTLQGSVLIEAPHEKVMASALAIFLVWNFHPVAFQAENTTLLPFSFFYIHSLTKHLRTYKLAPFGWWDSHWQ